MGDRHGGMGGRCAVRDAIYTVVYLGLNPAKRGAYFEYHECGLSGGSVCTVASSGDICALEAVKNEDHARRAGVAWFADLDGPIIGADWSHCDAIGVCGFDGADDVDNTW